jgi:hypothetical protein
MFQVLNPGDMEVTRREHIEEHVSAGKLTMRQQNSEKRTNIRSKCFKEGTLVTYSFSTTEKNKLTGMDIILRNEKNGVIIKVNADKTYDVQFPDRFFCDITIEDVPLKHLKLDPANTSCSEDSQEVEAMCWFHTELLDAVIVDRLREGEGERAG